MCATGFASARRLMKTLAKPVAHTPDLIADKTSDAGSSSRLKGKSKSTIPTLTTKGPGRPGLIEKDNRK